MRKMWDYAQLSKLAKSFGGPEKLLRAIKNESAFKGALIATPLAVLGTKLVDYLADKYRESKEAAKAAEQELLEGIRQYDQEHPDPNDSDEGAK